MKTGRALQALITLLVSGMLLWNTTAQAFSFCFSFGSKGRGSAYSQSRYYQPYGAWLPPPMPVMSYSYAPHISYYGPAEAYAGETAVAPVENQGLDYIMK